MPSSSSSSSWCCFTNHCLLPCESVSKLLTCLATLVATLAIWNSYAPSILQDTDQHKSFVSQEERRPPVLLFGPPTALRIVLLPDSKSVQCGHHIGWNASLSIVEKSMVDWDDCALLMRWTMPPWIIVDVNQLNRQTYPQIAKGSVSMKAAWSTNRPVDPEQPMYKIKKTTDLVPFVLEARISFEHALWKPSSDLIKLSEVSYEAQLLGGATIRCLLPNKPLPRHTISIPGPVMDFVCTIDRDKSIAVDLFPRGARLMAIDAHLPVTRDTVVALWGKKLFVLNAKSALLITNAVASGCSLLLCYVAWKTFAC